MHVIINSKGQWPSSKQAATSYINPKQWATLLKQKSTFMFAMSLLEWLNHVLFLFSAGDHTLTEAPHAHDPTYQLFTYQLSPCSVDTPQHQPCMYGSSQVGMEDLRWASYTDSTTYQSFSSAKEMSGTFDPTTDLSQELYPQYTCEVGVQSHCMMTDLSLYACSRSFSQNQQPNSWCGGSWASVCLCVCVYVRGEKSLWIIAITCS